MKPEQIQRLRELEVKATGGKWFEQDGEIVAVQGLPTPETVATFWHDWEPADRNVVIEARNALPELLDDWERMVAEIKRLSGGES